jgi:signal peptidase I
MDSEEWNSEGHPATIAPAVESTEAAAVASAFDLLAGGERPLIREVLPEPLPLSIPVTHRTWFGGLAATTCKVGLLVVLAWGLLFNFSEVRGSSMAPGIHDRDRILVDQISYLVGDVARGDVVVLRYPLDPSLDYIKRVIGLPGDEVTILGGDLFINGDLVTEPYVDSASVDPYTRLYTRVADGHYFVLGDNRLRSSDSREFGQVSRDLLRGKVRMRVWPPDRAGWIE